MIIHDPLKRLFFNEEVPTKIADFCAALQAEVSGLVRVLHRDAAHEIAERVRVMKSFDIHVIEDYSTLQRDIEAPGRCGHVTKTLPFYLRSEASAPD